ncbi:unnamed protein product [Closterium sp. Naga37s-1]|nr:unnamed protein product [Closterium sp. Naga37s-1]
MPVSAGNDYYSYSPRPFVVASAAVALPNFSSPAPAAVGMSPLPAPRSAPSSVTQAGPVLAPAAAPVPVVALLSAPAVALGHAPASSPAPAHASASAPAPAPVLAASSDPTQTPAPAPVVPPVPVGVSTPMPVIAASSAAAVAASVPPPVAPAVAPSAADADPTYQPPPATSAGLSSAELPPLNVLLPRAVGSIGLIPLCHVTSGRHPGGGTIHLGAVVRRRTGLHPVAAEVAGGEGVVAVAAGCMSSR